MPVDHTEVQVLTDAGFYVRFKNTAYLMSHYKAWTRLEPVPGEG